jgi:hypothetical protein
MIQREPTVKRLFNGLAGRPPDAFWTGYWRSSTLVSGTEFCT